MNNYRNKTLEILPLPLRYDGIVPRGSKRAKSLCQITEFSELKAEPILLGFLFVLTPV